jgi:pimeloyl-ACP methyl ester carboxylesterase
MNAVAQIVALWLKRGLALVRSVGPYALIEIVLPGGTLIALLLWLARRGAFSTGRSIELMPTHYAKQLDRPVGAGLRLRPMNRACFGLLSIALGWASVANAGVALHACELPGVKRAAKCGVVEVPENPDQPDGRRLQLAVAIVPAETRTHDDPIVPLMGGPGEDAISAAEYYLSTIGPLLQDRDLLLIDQRGTGKSNALRCKLYDPQNARRSLRDLFPAEAVKRCAKELSTRADLTQYTYPNLARDLEHVRRTLGYGPLNITAGSYGTRSAQVYLRMYPQSVRTVYLGSVVPLDVETPLTMAKTAEAAREKTFDACAADSACRAAFPNLPQEFEAIGRQLDAGKTPLDRGRVAEWFRSLTYRPYSATDLPWLIHRAHAGDWKPIEQGILENAAGGDSALSFGLLFSITCNDDVAFITEQAIARETQGTFLRDYRVRQQQGACHEWPKNPRPTDRTPIKTAVPTLFVSGDSDAATPLWFTERVAAGFSQRAEVIAAGQGHTEWSECVAGFYERLVRDGSVRNLRGGKCPAVPRPPFKTR